MKTEKIQCICETELSKPEISALIRLYQPVFSVPALALYFTLYECGRQNMVVSQETLCSMVHLDIDQLRLNRQELERFQLLRSFKFEDTLIASVQKPLTMIQFISHPMFGRLYNLVCGYEAYKAISIECLKQVPAIQGDEISKPFDASRLAVWNEDLELNYEPQEQKPFAPHFDVESFFSTWNTTIFPPKMRTDGLKRVIAEAGSLYHISYADMRSLLLKIANFKDQSIDERKLIREIHEKFGRGHNQVPTNVENPYELNPVEFLRYKQNNEYVPEVDRRLIESLSKNFKFSNPVINMLLEYVLEYDPEKFTKSYVERIATSWKREKVETLEDAAKMISKGAPRKKHYSNSRAVDREMPVFSTDDSIEEDVEAIRKALKDKYGKGGTT